MTNEQLYLMIGIPLLFNGVFLTLINSNLNSRMTTVENRISAVEARMGALESTLMTRFDLLMGRLAELEKEIHKR